MRKDIQFKTTDGTILRGWHYLPDASGRHPTIVLSHGFSAVKEMYLDKYADTFAQAGFASVVYDNRNFGASDGEPRPGGHFDAYVDGFDQSFGAARDWFRTHLQQ